MKHLAYEQFTGKALIEHKKKQTTYCSSTDSSIFDTIKREKSTLMDGMGYVFPLPLHEQQINARSLGQARLLNLRGR